MEELLQYVWKHKIFPLSPLETTEGQAVEVLHPGLHNHDAGPDFFNAKVKIDGQLWVGNVEIHLRSSDWFRHHHDSDPAYQNVILHVVAKADLDVDIYTTKDLPANKDSQSTDELTASNAQVRRVPQLVLPIPKEVQERYDELVRSDRIPRCRLVVERQPALTIHSWLTALHVERLEQKTVQMMARHELCERSWEHTFFVTLARNFGFGINGDAFEAWARSIPLQAVAKHRDSLFQVEAIFFGQAGLLEQAGVLKKDDKKEIADDYLERLKKEYAYLRQKFSLMPIDGRMFRFARLRPSNSPYIRMAQLAMLYYQQKLSFARVLNNESIEDFRALLTADSGCSVSPFWTTHYSFSSQVTETSDKRLSDASKDLLLINTFSPILFAYGRYKNEETYCERAVSILEALKPERNWITRAWAEAGVTCESAADSQALIQLTRQYCEPRNCLRCRFGHEFIRQNPKFLQENKDEKTSF